MNTSSRSVLIFTLFLTCASLAAVALEGVAAGKGFQSSKAANAQTRQVGDEILQDVTEQAAVIAALLDKIANCGNTGKFYNKETDLCQ